MPEYERGVGLQAKLAELFGVGISFVEKLFMRVRNIGEIAPKQHTGGTRPASMLQHGSHCSNGWQYNPISPWRSLPNTSTSLHIKST